MRIALAKVTGEDPWNRRNRADEDPEAARKRDAAALTGFAAMLSNLNRRE